MSSKKRSSSSSEEDDHRYAMVDEKKRKRMISNRESARRSRMKREQHIKDLNDQVVSLSNSSKEMIQKINNLVQSYVAIESENRILRAQREELGKRLEAMEMLSSYAKEANQFTSWVYQPQSQDPWMKPWQPLLQSEPIMTSAGNFQF